MKKKLHKNELNKIVGGTDSLGSKIPASPILKFLSPEDPVKKFNRQTKLEQARQFVESTQGVINPIRDLRNNIKG